MNYAEANELLQQVRQERPELFSGTVHIHAVIPFHDENDENGWRVHIGQVSRYVILVDSNEKWEDWRDALSPPVNERLLFNPNVHRAFGSHGYHVSKAGE